MDRPVSSTDFTHPQLLGALCFSFLLAGCSAGLSRGSVVASHAIDSLSPGESREFSVPIASGSPLLLRASQQEVDLRLEYRLPGSRDDVCIASSLRREGEELAVIESSVAGAVRVRVVAERNSKPAGSSKLIAERIPVESSADRARASGWRAFAAAANTHCAKPPDGAAKEAQLLASAAEDFATAGMNDERGLALLALGYLHLMETSDWPAALVALDDARSSFALSENDAMSAQADVLAGSALTELAMAVQGEERKRKLEDAKRRIGDAVAAHSRIERRFDRAIALNYLGLTCYYARELSCAEQHYSEARDEFHSLRELVSEDMTLQNLAVVNTERGEYRAAAESYAVVLGRWPADTELHGYADTLNNSALALVQLGETDKALEQQQRSREIVVALGDKGGEARALQGLGSALAHSGAYDRALPLLEGAIALRRATGNRSQIAASLRSLGAVQRELGFASKALDLHREARTFSDDLLEQMRITVELAADLEALGRSKEALELLQAVDEKSLPDGHPVRGLLSMSRGWLLVTTGEDRERGLASLREAIDIFAARSGRLLQVRAQSRLAAAQFELRQYEAAASSAVEALALARTVRLGLSSTALRLQIAAIERDAADVRIAALMARNLTVQGLLALEESHALLLDDLARERSVRMTPSGAADARAMTELISGKLFRAQQLLDRREPPLDEYAALQQEVALLQAKLDTAFASSTREGSSRAAASLDALQAAVGDRTAIEYFLGARASWAWIISREHVHAVRLPDRTQIRQAARALTKTLANPLTKDSLWSARANELSQLVLARLPLASTASRLVIVPDDVLHAVPFALLPRQIPGRMLLDSAEVTYASTLAPFPVAAPASAETQAHRVLIVADPIFASLQPLPGSAREADSLAVLLKSSNVSVLRGFDANLSRLTAVRGQYDVVHFGTHARVHPADARLSAIALSQLDRSGKPIDGWLQSADILRLQFVGKLIVLSGCDTAAGQLVEGEGVAGLSQAFLIGGSEHVIAARWALPDAMAAELMSATYASLIGAKNSAPAALRDAQLAIRASVRWNHPYYWSGLAVFGRPTRGPEIEGSAKTEKL
jgi:CHAT domain-containing protein